MKYLCKRSFISKHTFMGTIILKKNNYYKCEFITATTMNSNITINFILVTDKNKNKRRFNTDDFYKRFYTITELRKQKLLKINQTQ